MCPSQFFLAKSGTPRSWAYCCGPNISKEEKGMATWQAYINNCHRSIQVCPERQEFSSPDINFAKFIIQIFPKGKSSSKICSAFGYSFVKDADTFF